jgi:hypothetical protein
VGTGVLYRGYSGRGREVHNSSRCRAEVKEEWNYTSAPAMYVMTWRGNSYDDDDDDDDDIIIIIDIIKIIIIKKLPHIFGTFKHVYKQIMEHAVAQSVETLRYRSEGRGFDSRWCHWNFSLT